MRVIRTLTLAFSLVVCSLLAFSAAQAQVTIGISVDVEPPPLPVYDQPTAQFCGPCGLIAVSPCPECRKSIATLPRGLTKVSLTVPVRVPLLAAPEEFSHQLFALLGVAGCEKPPTNALELILESQVHRCSQFYSHWRAIFLAFSVCFTRHSHG